ncbi:MAG: cbb3-type cytochrome c oxidase subunit II [Capsulimonadaceae bacterium]
MWMLIGFVVLLIIAIGVIRAVWGKHEKNAILTGIGIWGTFTVGLIFTLLIPSFNENWSYATARDEAHYHLPYTTQELRGRLIYQREGCMYCHTQQVRPLEGEMKRYSVGTSLAIPADEREYVYDVPHFLGTRRIGPDLSRVGGKYSDDWHYSHFYYPRQLVPDSVMPAFTWLFTQKGDAPPVPTSDCRALVAYIQTLGYERQVMDPDTHQYRSWLKPEDQMNSQARGEEAVERIVPEKIGSKYLQSPIRGGDVASPTNVVLPKQ